MGLRSCFVTVMCGLCLCTAPPHGDNHDSSRSVSIKWKPNLQKQDFDLEPLKGYGGLRFQILPITDNREDPSYLGEVPKDKLVKDTLVPLITSSDMAAWCTDGFVSALKYLGLQTVDKKGDIVIECEISQLTLNEKTYQRGDAGLRVSARSASEMLIWEGSVSGKSELYSRPAGSDGNSECLSNTMITTIYNLLIEKSFSDAIVKSN